jgi:hypothetical protein
MSDQEPTLHWRAVVIISFVWMVGGILDGATPQEIVAVPLVVAAWALSAPAKRPHALAAWLIASRTRRNERKFTGQVWLLNFSLPNFYFHYTTAYDILRSSGVEVGKRDFMGTPITLA